MKREEFDGLIGRLEDFARAHPRRYVMRVALLAAAGYAYLFGVLLFLAASMGVLVWLLLAFPNAAIFKIAFVWGVLTLGLGSVILRALWVRLKPPEGLELTPARAPALFAMLEDLRVRLQAPRFHRVLLIGDFNAAVLQVPRLGVFGWQQNYLLLGLPMMQALSPEQFRAVVAHEFGHLSRNHSRFASWIYRVRRTWDRVFEQIAARRQRGAALLLKFIRWYAPYFNAYSFVLARANEYQADRCAVECAGVETAAEALIRTQVQGRLLAQSVWPGIFRQAALQSAPPPHPFASVAESFRAGPAPEAERKWITQAFQVSTSNADTHPCLKDRLAGMGYACEASQVQLLPLPTVTAADQLLGAALESCRVELDHRWHSAVERSWKKRFDQAQKLQARLVELEQQYALKPPTIAERWERAQITVDLQGDEAAEPLVREILAIEPNHPGANFLVGRQLLARDDEDGVAFIERAMNAEVDAVKAGCDLLYGFYQRTGRQDKIRGLFERFDRHSAERELARQERARVTVKDTFLPHELNAGQISDLRRQLEEVREVGAAHLARKAVRHFPEKPLYVLAVRPDVKWYRLRSAAADRQLVHRLVTGMRFPGQTLVFVANHNLAALGRKVRKMPGARIFDRAASGN